MKFGIALPNYGPEATPENLISIAKLAEHLGYESIWATDHVPPSSLFESPYNHIYEPLTVLSFLAAITENVMLGTSSRPFVSALKVKVNMNFIGCSFP